MGQGAGGGSADNLVGVRSRGNCRGDAQHDEQRRHKKTSANAKNAREQSNGSAQAQYCRHVYAVSGNGQVHIQRYVHTSASLCCINVFEELLFQPCKKSCDEQTLVQKNCARMNVNLYVQVRV